MKVVDNTKEVSEDIRQRAIVLVTRMALMTQTEIKLRAPVGKVAGGNLRHTIRTQVLESAADTKVTARVGSTTFYAPFVEFGTGEYHEFGKGRQGGWSYKGPDDEWRFTRGNKPLRFFRNGFDALVKSGTLDRMIREFYKKK